MSARYAAPILLAAIIKTRPVGLRTGSGPLIHRLRKSRQGNCGNGKAENREDYLGRMSHSSLLFLLVRGTEHSPRRPGRRFFDPGD
jgi:hypothetical protein